MVTPASPGAPFSRVNLAPHLLARRAVIEQRARNRQIPLGEFEQRTRGVLRAIELIHMLHDAEADTCDIADRVAELAAALGYITGDNLPGFLLGIHPWPKHDQAKAARRPGPPRKVVITFFT